MSATRSPGIGTPHGEYHGAAEMTKRDVRWLRRQLQARRLTLEDLVIRTFGSLVGAARTYRGEMLFALAWLVLLVVAERTSRTPELFAGSCIVVVFVGALRYLEGLRRSAQELERERAAEIALSVQPPRVISEAERRQCEALRSRIALAIRGQGAHLREG